LTVLLIRDSFFEVSEVLAHGPPGHLFHLGLELRLVAVTAEENDFAVLAGGIALRLRQHRRERAAGWTPVRAEVK